MSIQFDCQGCGDNFTVDEAMAGRKARCRKCGAIVTVPDSQGDLQPLEDYSAAHVPYAPPQSFPAKPKPIASSLPPWIWAAAAVGAGAVVMLLVVVAASVVIFGGDRTQTISQGASSSGVDRLPQFQPPSDSNAAHSSAASSPGYSPPAATPTGPDPYADGETATADGWPASQPHSTSVNASDSGDSSKSSDSSATSAEWGGGKKDGLHIPYQQHRTPITVGPFGCPIVIVGEDVWHLEQQRIVQQIQGEYDQRAVRALSGDGEWFAVASKSPNQKGTSVTVYHTTTGQPHYRIAGSEDVYLDVVVFSRSKYLLLGGRHSNVMQVFDVEQRKLQTRLMTACDRIKEGQIAFTPNGEYYACPDDETDIMTVYHTKNGRKAATMASPGPMANMPGEAPRPGISDATFVYAWLRDLKFSPDGQQLAAISRHPRPRLMCWSSRGKLELDVPLDSMSSVFFSKASLQWLPDGSGWLVNGHVFDRATQRIVMGIEQPFGRDRIVHVLDEKRLLGVFPHNPSQLEVLEIPWDELRASLKLMEQRAPAILRPGKSVSINIQLGQLRGGAEQTKQKIIDALVTRLKRDGISPAGNQDTFFMMRFAEKTGDTLPIYERQSILDFRGHDTGRTATEAVGSLVVELYVAGRSTPIWRESIQATSSRSFREEINDASIRESMVRSIVRKIHELNFPYFIPESEERLAIPLIIE